MQLYTFFETTLVTVALLPQFISFFGDLEEDSSFPSTLATTFLGFGENFQITLHSFLVCLSLWSPIDHGIIYYSACFTSLESGLVIKSNCKSPSDLNPT
jgi:hypothetical protein